MRRVLTDAAHPAHQAGAQPPPLPGEMPPLHRPSPGRGALGPVAKRRLPPGSWGRVFWWHHPLARLGPRWVPSRPQLLPPHHFLRPLSPARAPVAPPRRHRRQPRQRPLRRVLRLPGCSQLRASQILTVPRCRRPAKLLEKLPARQGRATRRQCRARRSSRRQKAGGLGVRTQAGPAEPGTAPLAGSWLVFPRRVFQLIAPGTGGTMPGCSPRSRLPAGSCFPNHFPGRKRRSPSPARHAGR